MIYEMTVHSALKVLTNLEGVLAKGAAFADSKKIDFEVLLNSRLAPDQFNLLRQVQITCDMAKLAAARLSGIEAPVHEDNEKTLAQLLERIGAVKKFLTSLKPNDFVGALDKHITTPRWEGKYLTGREYLLEHALPNIYFHMTTAYSILRHNGVDIGKKDFLGELPFKS